MALARALSILGHPALLMPAAVSLANVANGAPARLTQVALWASALVAGIVGVYSGVQVRQGRWGHVDASAPAERRQLNLVVGVLLFGVAALLWLSGQPPVLALGLALGGALVAVAQALRRWMKLSQHAGFAAYAAALVWPHTELVWGLAAFALGIGWSRLVLQRHTRAEVVAGWGVGVLAGLSFHGLMR